MGHVIKQTNHTQHDICFIGLDQYEQNIYRKKNVNQHSNTKLKISTRYIIVPQYDNSILRAI